MSTISPEAPPTVRQSVYWLSVLATRLQKETSSVDTSRSTRVKTPNSNTRSLNHLAALLTRGKNDSDSMESTRIVAVTLGSFQADSIHLSVFASPPSSPTTSPTVSPSSSSSSGVADCPDGTTAATKVEKVASLVFTRNSRDEKGERSSFTIPMAPAESLLCAFSLIVRANYSSLDVRDTILLAPLVYPCTHSVRGIRSTKSNPVPCCRCAYDGQPRQAK
ncbi:hypothetical protein C8J57DRAFT_367558 [Mycena rebaudengoi]|nr:hypothetical protein C8J57DRAFT_367558 [Mycena rebaudengoi]